MKFAQLTSACVFIFPIFGLLSCSREKKVLDVFQAVTPLVRHDRHAIDIESWEASGQSDLALPDVVDVSASHPSRVEVLAHCRIDDRNFISRRVLDGPGAIKIFQITPLEVLTVDLMAREVPCDFELTLINGNGSRHIFNLAQIALHDGGQEEVHLAEQPEDPKLPYFHASPVVIDAAVPGQFRLRFGNAGIASAQVVCEDVVLPPLDFNQVLDLAHMDFRAPSTRKGKSPLRLSGHLLQTCRAVISENGQRVAISRLFKLRFPPLTLGSNGRNRSLSPDA